MTVSLSFLLLFSGSYAAALPENAAYHFSLSDMKLAEIFRHFQVAFGAAVALVEILYFYS